MKQVFFSVLLMLSGAVAGADVTPSETATPAGVAGAEIAGPADVSDVVAARFLNTCAGCHSLEGLKLNGPDLSHVSAWPQEQLKAAIKRMEAKVGPLKDEDIAALSEFLQSLDLRERLAAEGERIRAKFAAKLEPADAAKGQALFHGRSRFANGGLSCVACHAVNGAGGRLGPDLAASFEKMGETPLRSSLEKVGFKIMAPHYEARPITAQEVAHVVAYMQTLKKGDRVSGGAPVWKGCVLGLALFGCAGLVAYGGSGLKRRSKPLEYRKR